MLSATYSLVGDLLSVSCLCGSPSVPSAASPPTASLATAGIAATAAAADADAGAGAAPVAGGASKKRKMAVGK